MTGRKGTPRIRIADGTAEREDLDKDQARQPKRKGNTPAKQAINKHLYRHHGGQGAPGTALERMQHHDDLHWSARQAGVDLGHTHLPYQDGETDEQMAERLLAEGTAPPA